MAKSVGEDIFCRVAGTPELSVLLRATLWPASTVALKVPGFLFLEAAVLRCSGKLVHAWLHHKVGSLEGAYWVWGGFVLCQRSMIIFFVDRSPTPKGRSWAAAHPRQWRRHAWHLSLLVPAVRSWGASPRQCLGWTSKEISHFMARQIFLALVFVWVAAMRYLSFYLTSCQQTLDRGQVRAFPALSSRQFLPRFIL